MFRSRACAGVIAALLLVAPGCAENAGDDQAADAGAEPVVRTVDRGPVKLTVTAGKSQVSIAQRLDLTIEVTADPDIEVELPEFGASLAEFQVRDFDQKPVRTEDDGRRTYVQTYDLDIFLSGEYTIPGITAKYRESPADDESDARPFAELTTEPMTIQVTSLLEGEFDPQAFHGVKPVAELRVPRSWRSIAVTTAGGLLALVVFGLIVAWLLRRMLRPADLVRQPPDEWALAQLRALAEEGLIEQGQLQPFYYRLSEIARRYIELRFGLMAPERTTEEFLIEMRGGSALSRAHQASLGEFMEACDLVKYARHEPGAAEIEQAFNAARDFVIQTRPVRKAPAQSAPRVAQEVPA